METIENYTPSEDEAIRNFLVYSQILDIIKKSEPEIELVNIHSHTIEFKKHGKSLNHAIATWQAAADPNRGFTPEDVAEMIIDWGKRI